VASAKIIPIRSFRAAQFHEYRKVIGENYAHAFAHLDAGEHFPMFAFASKPLAEIIPLFAFASELAERIAQATQEAHAGIRKLSNEQLKPLLKELKTAEKSVRQAIMDFDHDPRNATQALRLANLNSLKTQIDAAIDNAVKNQTLLPVMNAEGAMHTGLLAGVNDLRAQEAVGGWGSLTAAQAATVSEAAFALVDGAALSFLSTYRLELAGTVADDLKSKIKSALTTGIVNGEPLYEVSRKLGHVITDPEKFRKAGGMLFPSAANRLQLIVKTENMRAHNQGRVAFYGQVGIENVRWIVAGRNTCADCQQYNDVVFSLEKLPPQPLHPDCECTIVGERMESTKTPADYGVDVAEREGVGEAAKIPRIDGPENKWPGMPHGITYRTDAITEKEKAKVVEYAEHIASRSLALRARPDKLAGGYELRLAPLTSAVEIRGTYNHVEKRVNILLKREQKIWRDKEEVFRTYLEEIGHAKTEIMGWCKTVEKRGFIISKNAPKEVHEIMDLALSNTPDFNLYPDLFDEWYSAKRDRSDEEVKAQLLAKLWRQNLLDPESIASYSKTVEGLGRLPEFLRKIK
jgi:hypothetical protein